MLKHGGGEATPTVYRACMTYVTCRAVLVTCRGVLAMWLSEEQYSRTSEQQPPLGTGHLAFVERLASLRGLLQIVC